MNKALIIVGIIMLLTWILGYPGWYIPFFSSHYVKAVIIEALVFGLLVFFSIL